MLVIGILAGAVAGLTVSVWLTPTFVADTFIGSSERQRGMITKPDPAFVNVARQRMVDIYDTQKKVGNIGYPQKSYIGSAVVLSSDGWVVAHVPSYKTGAERSWELVDNRGTPHPVVQSLFDQVTGLLYLKARFDIVLPVVELADASGLLGEAVWVVGHGEWQGGLVEEPQGREEDKVSPLWSPQYRYAVTPTPQSGAIVLTEDGRVAGFVDEEHLLLDAWLIHVQLSLVLTENRVQYYGLPIEGVILERILVNGDLDDQGGFYVQKSSVREVRVGDVITAIQGEPVRRERFARQVLSAPIEVTLTIRRSGNTLEEVVVKKVIVR